MAPSDVDPLDAPAEAEGARSSTLARPTLVPQFDLQLLAEETEFRERALTVTDEALLEEARLRSMDSMRNPPVGEPEVESSEVDVGEADLETLGPDEQVALLRERLSPLSRVPALTCKLSELGALGDPKTTFVLGFVDGLLPLEIILDVIGLPELDALRIVDRLVERGVLVFQS